MAIKDKSQRWGITETGEVAFNLDCFDNLYMGNTIITKRLTDKLIDKIVENKEKIILHLTVTGHGGDILEPLVPTVYQTREKFSILIEKGFPVEQVVLRIDPIIPTRKGMDIALSVIDAFKDCRIKRVRISFLDMYNHVKERFKEAELPLPYESFHADINLRLKCLEEIKAKGLKFGFDIEACGEPGIESIPCLSQKDVDILGLTDKITLIGSAEQRGNCHCPSNKTQILRERPHRCANKCLYCFWKETN